MTIERAIEILKEPGRISVNLITANDEEAIRYNVENIEALDMAINGLETLKEKKEFGKWIPCKERKPKNTEHDWVLAQVREKPTRYLYLPKVLEYRESKDDWYSDELGGWLKDNPDDMWEVVAWMPLPEKMKVKYD